MGDLCSNGRPLRSRLDLWVWSPRPPCRPPVPRVSLLQTRVRAAGSAPPPVPCCRAAVVATVRVEPESVPSDARTTPRSPHSSLPDRTGRGGAPAAPRPRDGPPRGPAARDTRSKHKRFDPCLFPSPGFQTTRAASFASREKYKNVNRAALTHYSSFRKSSESPISLKERRGFFSCTVSVARPRAGVFPTRAPHSTQLTR